MFNMITPEELWELKDLILERLDFVDVLLDYGIEVSDESHNSLKYKSSCPLPNHYGKGENGEDRTPSFCISKNKFYCFGCFAEDQYIWTKNGLTKVQDINKDSEILQGDGNFVRNPILTKKKVNKIINFGLKSFKYDQLRLTEDHLCLCLNKNNIKNLPFIINNRNRKFGIKFISKKKNFSYNIPIIEKEARYVEVGDFFLMPIIPTSKRNLNILYKKNILKEYTKGPKNERIEYLPIDEDLAWLYGIWLAEGSIGVRQIKWSFHINETEYIQKVFKIIDEKFGLKVGILNRPNKNICELSVCNEDLKKQFAYWFGIRSDGKKIPIEAMFWLKNIQKSFIRGYLDGDGSISKDVASTVSKKLGYGMYNLAIQCNYLPTLSYRKSYVDKNNVNHKEKWIFSLKTKESISGFTIIIDNNEYYCSIIDNIFEETGNFNVYDISLFYHLHHLITPMCVTHNCNSHGNVLDFISKMEGTPIIEILRTFGNKFGLIEDGVINPLLSVKKERKEKNPAIDDIVYDTYVLIRKYRNEHNDYEWIEKLSEITENLFNNLGFQNWEKALFIKNRVIEKLKERGKNI